MTEINMTKQLYPALETDTRLFFVVDSVEDNKELYDTLEHAEVAKACLNKKNSPRIRVCLVRHAYKEEMDGLTGWNYDDQADTFTDITPDDFTA
ncbi:MAG: hypothetical protein IPL32_18840 [Chloracidobacterium sp.]|nr:hypothetical protein [Chloracidobacterium sp.]